MRDILLDNGFSITSDSKTGSPILKFFDTHIDLGHSKLNLSGNLAAWIVNWFTLFFNVPVQVLFNEFFEPSVNLLLARLIVPKVLRNGLFEIPSKIKDYQGTLVVDLTLPQPPLFY